MAKKFASFIAVVSALILLLACQTQATEVPSSVAAPTSEAAPSSGLTIVLGDIEPNEPGKILRRFEHLSNYLAAQLNEFGATEGRVVVARDIEEMARFIKEGRVDLYFDSAFPFLAVQELADSELILRGWKGGSPEYWSTYVALRGNGVESLEDLAGGIVAFEEPFSTSGFILPAGTLIQLGFDLAEVDGPGSAVADDVIGYFFSRDEENTIELILSGQVTGGGISDQDYEALPTEIPEQLVTLGRTIAVPRQLVSIRSDLDPELASELRDILIGLEQTPEGVQILTRLKKTTRFDALPLTSAVSLAQLERLIKLVSGE